ncbi:MAG: YcxB family protein [Planctomycetales bacterium]|nr:YcxB family protein [Planctomycetales bacterium]
MNPNPYHPSQIDSALRQDPPVLAQLVGGEGLTVEYQLVPHDVVQFVIFHHQTSPANRWRVFRAIAIVSTVLLLVFGLVARQAMRNRELWPAVAFVGLFGISFIVAYPYIYRRQLQSIATRMYSEGKNLILFGQTRMSISPDFLNYATPYSQSLIRWIALEKVATSVDAAYFYITSANAHVVPRRAFASDTDFQTFVHTAQDFYSRAVAAENPLRTSV